MDAAFLWTSLTDRGIWLVFFHTFLVIKPQGVYLASLSGCPVFPPCSHRRVAPYIEDFYTRTRESALGDAMHRGTPTQLSYL